MFERQYTKIDLVRQRLDAMLKNCADPEVTRTGYVHLYGVGQACALIALHRGHDRAYAELAEIAGMLHDYCKYRDGIEEQHGELSSVEAKSILEDIGCFSVEEIQMMCDAISKHSNKEHIDTEFDEILKDADDFQRFLRNPVEDYFFRRKRNQKLLQEIGIIQ